MRNKINKLVLFSNSIIKNLTVEIQKYNAINFLDLITIKKNKKTKNTNETL